MKKRCAGILLPITALPSRYGIGTIGDGAKAFVDFLKMAKQTIWQVLPLVPTGYGDSPYASSCAIAGSPYLIDIDELIKEGLLTQEEADADSCKCEWNGGRVNYEMLFYRRIPLLKLAFSRFNRKTPAFRAFLDRGEYQDFAVFMALKEAHGWVAFSHWEEPYRTRDAKALATFCRENEDAILFWHFTQYQFFRQWEELKAYANARGIRIMGDMPLYVSDDSAEVWGHPELFLLNGDGAPTVVAGVPPDYFSEIGQLWGNPIYNWDKMKENGFAWWNERLKKALSMYDFVRIDHFRGFDRYYAIPAGSVNAKTGHWCDGPKEALFEDKKDWKIIAEDLGILDDGVYRLMKNTGYPGMKVLEFAFDGDCTNKYKPSNFGENGVVYTGTHDNDTLVGFIESMDEEKREAFYTDLKSELDRCGIEFDFFPWMTTWKETVERAREAIVRMAFESRAEYVIIPLQDHIGTGSETRINTPGTLNEKNWSWSCPENVLDESLARRIAGLTERSDRA